MRPLSILPFLLMLASCNPPESKSAKPAVPAAEKATAPAVVEWNVKSSVVRLNSTQQTWNPWQPWEKNPPVRRRALAAIIGPQLVVTTSELVADATYLEFESADGSRFTPAKVIAVDYEANLALLGPASETQGAELFANSLPFKVAAPAKIGDTLEVLQLEDNGLPLVTPGTLQSVDVSPNLLPGGNSPECSSVIIPRIRFAMWFPPTSSRASSRRPRREPMAVSQASESPPRAPRTAPCASG
jgi:S1-C subfamily serine protease